METRRELSIPEEIRLVRVLVPGRQIVHRQQPLFIYANASDGRRSEFCSPFAGQLETWLAREGDSIPAGKPVAILREPCSHPVNFGGLCGICGKDLTVPDVKGNRDDSNVDIMIAHKEARLFVSREEANRLEKDNAERLRKHRKLSLILDLDQTVIHATMDVGMEHYYADPKFKNLPALQDVSKFNLPDSPGVYFLKLRPGLREFLQETQKYYEFHIYTMGTRNYAAQVSQIIDPEGSIFVDRILSRDESGSMTRKTIQRLFPCDDSMVVALDDRADVWEWSRSLIKVRPYHFFTGTGDINEPGKPVAGSSDNSDLPPPPVEEVPLETSLTADDEEDTRALSPQDHTPPEELKLSDAEIAQLPFPLQEHDHELETLTRVLRQLHQEFYRRLDQGDLNASVKEILPRIKSQVLDGMHLAFSGVIPLGMNPEVSEIWRLASSFGARCYLHVTPQLTHLVAGRMGTEKVRQVQQLQASSRHPIWTVRPEWLYESFSHWEKQPEEPFLLEAPVDAIALLPEDLDSTEDLCAGEKSALADLGDDLDLPSDLGTSGLDRSELSQLNREIEEELDGMSDDDDEEDTHTIEYEEDEDEESDDRRDDDDDDYRGSVKAVISADEKEEEDSAVRSGQRKRKSGDLASSHGAKIPRYRTMSNASQSSTGSVRQSTSSRSSSGRHRRTTRNPLQRSRSSSSSASSANSSRQHSSAEESLIHDSDFDDLYESSSENE